jgi:hypothetical protein
VKQEANMNNANEGNGGNKDVPANGEQNTPNNDATQSTSTPAVAGATDNAPQAVAQGAEVASITVSMQGKETGQYVGPAGKSIREMFPNTKFESLQVRYAPGSTNQGRMAALTQPVLASISLNTVERAALG